MCSGGSGVIFHGGCPVRPPTHSLKSPSNLSSIESFYDVIFNIPHSAINVSYLFKVPLLAWNTINFIGGVSNHKNLTLNLTPTHSKGNSFNVQSVVEYSDQIIQIRTTVNFKTKPMSCIKPIREEIRIWYDSRYLFIWSCKENAQRTHRDEALIVCSESAAVHSGKEDAMDYRAWTSLARKYVSQDMMNRIATYNIRFDWAVISEERLFFCPRVINPPNYKYKYINVFIPISIVLIVMGILATLYCYYW